MTDNSGASAGSTNTVIFNPNKSPSSKILVNQPTSPMNTWNPVLDRLMGNKNQQLRNESYYRVSNHSSYRLVVEWVTMTRLKLLGGRVGDH